MKFLVPNYSCLQNLWLGGYCSQIPVLSLSCPLNLLNPPPEKNSWVRHCMQQGNIYGHNTVIILNLATWHVGLSQSHVFTSSLQGCSTAYLARGYRHFEGTCCLHLHSIRVKMDAVGSSKILMPRQNYGPSHPKILRSEFCTFLYQQLTQKYKHNDIIYSSLYIQV